MRIGAVTEDSLQTACLWLLIERYGPGDDERLVPRFFKALNLLVDHHRS